MCKPDFALYCFILLEIRKEVSRCVFYIAAIFVSLTRLNRQDGCKIFLLLFPNISLCLRKNCGLF